MAYSAVTGARLWAARYNGPGNGNDAASAVAVSPGGSRVFVTGASQGARSGPDYATVAYSAVTGARRWAARYNGPGNGNDAASAVAVSPGGGRVFVTGASQGARSGPDYATVAYRRRPARGCGRPVTTARATAATRPPRWRSALTGAGCS